MSKQKLMLSAAAAALLAGSAHATTITCPSNTLCIKTSTTTALTTSTAGGSSTPENIYVFNDSDNGYGSIKVDTASTSAITVNSSHYVYSNGLIQNDGVSTAYGIKVDMSQNPNMSASSFPDVSNITKTGNAIYLDSSGSVYVTGKGTGKKAIWLDTSGVVSGSTGVMTGNIVMLSGSTISAEGDSSYGMYFGPNGQVNGNVLLGGTLSVTPTTATSTTASSMFGFYNAGKIVGDVYVSGTVQSEGEGSTGMFIAGNGIDGALRLTGTVVAEGCGTSCVYSSANTTKTVTYPEGGNALVIGSSITNGIYNSGTIQTIGTTAAVLFNPSVNYGAASLSTPTGITIGIYKYRDVTNASAALQYDTADPGFSFYNRSSIEAGPANENAGSVAISMTGYSSLYPTSFTGGFFNSGSISALTSSTNTSSTTATTTATAISIGNYVNMGGTGYNSTAGSYTPDYACAATGTCVGPTVDAYIGGGATGDGHKINGYDYAGFVNKSSITVTGSGTLGSSVYALAIGSGSNVSSLINMGTIKATASVISTRIDVIKSLSASAIIDNSGTLTYIYNYGGTIAAGASALDSGTETSYAILLSGNTQTPSGKGVSIISQSTASAGATISAVNTDGSRGIAVGFGGGDYQVLQIIGSSESVVSTVYGDVNYGSGGTHDRLYIGQYGVLEGRVTAPDGVDVTVDRHGVLVLHNDTAALKATRLYVDGNGISDTIGYLSVSVANAVMISSTNTNPDGTIAVGGTAGAAKGAVGTATLKSGATLKLNYESFVPQGSQSFVLISAPHNNLFVDDFTRYQAQVQQTVSNGGLKSYLFKTASLAYYSNNCVGQTGCVATQSGDQDRLILNVTPKTAAELNLTGYALTVFPYANAALVNESTLGSAMVSGISNDATAQAAYEAFAPSNTGGSRAIAISITDQATGPIGAHQRAQRMYARRSGGMTLWGNEFVQMIKDPGTGALNATTGYKPYPGFKDHGFGFVLGVDSGSPRYGWYGGALTFYQGDVNELARDAHQNQQWILLSFYSSWRGKGLFFDSKLDAGYGHIDGKRWITLGSYTRQADSKHAGALLSGGISTGALLSYGALTLMPQFSADGLFLREDGYTETNPSGVLTCATTSKGNCDAFMLKVNPAYAKSLRGFLGIDVRYDLDIGDLFLQPEGRAGFRYDFFRDPAKVKAAFAYADISGSTSAPGALTTYVGPTPAQASFVLGGSLAATSDTWTLGLNFDVVRGSNGAFQQVGTVNLLGRI